MSDALARKKFTEFKERAGTITDAELDDYWASLRPASIDGMLGEWKGGEFVTGALGAGHVVLPAEDGIDAAFDFYTKVVGLSHRDSMVVRIPGMPARKLRFQVGVKPRQFGQKRVLIIREAVGDLVDHAKPRSAQ